MKKILFKFASVCLAMIIFISLFVSSLSVSAYYNSNFSNSKLTIQNYIIDNNSVTDYILSKYSSINLNSKRYIRCVYILNDVYHCRIYECSDLAQIVETDNYYSIDISSRLYYYYSSSKISEIVIGNYKNSSYSFGTFNATSSTIYFNKKFTNFYYSEQDLLSDTTELNMIIDFNFDCGLSAISKNENEHNLYGGYLNRNEETWSAFLQWLVDNQYYTELSRYGLSITANNLCSIAETWWDKKFSPTLFYELIKLNGCNSLSSANQIISWFQTKWDTYINHNYVKIKIESDGDKTHHLSQDIDKDVIDENGNVIVEKDTTVISLLREILRNIINLPADIASSTYGFLNSILSNIADNVYSVCLSIYDLPDTIYNNFVSSINSILDAINNISVNNDNSSTTNINVDVNFNNDTDYNVSFGDLKIVLNNKFAFYNQLTQIDTIFREADFTDESSPEFSFSSVSISDTVVLPDVPLDFSLFDHYRSMIHSIIIAVSYLMFFINLLHRLPDVIGGI